MMPDEALPLSLLYSPEITSLKDIYCCLASTVKRVNKFHVDCLCILNSSCSSLIHADDKVSNISKVNFSKNILTKNSSSINQILP